MSKRISADEKRWGVAALAMFALATFSPMSGILESSMAAHVLVQIPMLVAIGVVWGSLIKLFIKSWLGPQRLNLVLNQINAGGISGILLASIALAFWMIPRWLDASITSDQVAWAKYLSLPIMVGIPLAWSWEKLHPIARGVVKIEFLTMLFRLGWLYLISPDRLCNNYLLSDQETLGRGFLAIGLALSITWLIPLFFGAQTEPDKVNLPHRI